MSLHTCSAGSSSLFLNQSSLSKLRHFYIQELRLTVSLCTLLVHNSFCTSSWQLCFTGLTGSHSSLWMMGLYIVEKKGQIWPQTFSGLMREMDHCCLMLESPNISPHSLKPQLVCQYRQTGSLYPPFLLIARIYSIWVKHQNLFSPFASTLLSQHSLLISLKCAFGHR